MKLKLMFFSLFAIITLFACSQKFPVPESDTTGVLVIPILIEKDTPHELGYYYKVEYLPNTGKKIVVYPKANEKCTIINEFPTGKYLAHRVHTASKGSRDGISLSRGGVNDIDPILFEIKPKSITMLDHAFSIKQFWIGHKNSNRWRQHVKIEMLDDNQINEIKSHIQNQANAKLWTWAEMSTTSDKSEIVTLFYEFANKGDSLAQYKLGLSYRTGRYTKRDTEESIKWFTKAAEQGQVEAQHVLGDIYYEKRMYGKQAIKWYTKAAEQGYEKSQFMLGNIYQYEKNYLNIREAAKWYKKAAKQGNDEAQTNLEIICIDNSQFCN